MKISVNEMKLRELSNTLSGIAAELEEVKAELEDERDSAAWGEDDESETLDALEGIASELDDAANAVESAMSKLEEVADELD